MRPLSILALVLPLLVGCGAPQGLEPLDLSPPRAERGLWEYDPSGYLRYDGHALGPLDVEGPGGTTHEEIEGDRQPAGQYETRARLLVRDDGDAVEVIAVGTLGEPAYYEAVTAQVASADAVVATVRARGLERGGEGQAAATAQSRLARATVEALRQRLVFMGDALRADERWAYPAIAARDRLAREAAQPDPEELDEAVADMHDLVDEHGVDTVVHVILVSRVRPRTGPVIARRGPIGEAGYELDAPAPETDEWSDFTWDARTLRDACLTSLEPLLAGPGPRRVALLVAPTTARAVAGALLKKGFVVREERWLGAIHVARP